MPAAASQGSHSQSPNDICKLQSVEAGFRGAETTEPVLFYSKGTLTAGLSWVFHIIGVRHGAVSFPIISETSTRTNENLENKYLRVTCAKKKNTSLFTWFHSVTVLIIILK